MRTALSALAFTPESSQCVQMACTSSTLELSDDKADAGSMYFSVKRVAIRVRFCVESALDRDDPDSAETSAGQTV